jgi:hypothetical protein
MGIWGSQSGGGGGSVSGDADDIDIADSGAYFDATEVESALQELGSKSVKFYLCEVSADVMEQGKDKIVRKTFEVTKAGVYDIAYKTTIGSTDINSRSVTAILSHKPAGGSFVEKTRSVENVSE